MTTMNDYDPKVIPWGVDEQEFPHGGDAVEKSIHLLRYAFFEFAKGHQLEASVEQHRRLLEEHELFPTVKTLRDKILAHFDRKHINDPSVIASEPVDIA